MKRSRFLHSFLFVYRGYTQVDQDKDEQKWKRNV